MAITAASGPTGLIATGLTVLAFAQKKQNGMLQTQVEYHKDDAAEGWAKATDANAQS